MTRLVLAWVLVNAILLAPTWVSAAVTGTPVPAWISVEAALITGGMALLPRRRWSGVLAWVVSAGVVMVSLVALVDLVFRVSLGRTLNLSLDLYLVDAVRRLAVGNMGALRAAFVFGAAGVLAGLSVAGMAWLLSSSRPDGGDVAAGRVPRVAGGLIAATLALALLGIGVDAISRRVGTPVASLFFDQVAQLEETRREQELFAADLAREPRSLAGVPDLFGRLRGRHVVVAYIESYGVAAIEDPELAAVVVPRLETAANRFAAAGLHVATGRLTSPTTGGQSWYAHGTMLSGLWLENQLRYELMLSSDRETLIDDFERAGYRTATVMPAITTPWPEAVGMGFDEVHTSQNIPYGGPPFYWVTMPDQFTWSFVGEVLRGSDTPLFVEVGMVSSHAPWTPVLPLVDWDAMGAGEIFEPYRLEGYPPDETWWDTGVLRDGYARSLAYSIEAMVGFAERFLDDRTLLIVPGDHQAAPWVTGATGADVPVHVIARDPALIEPFLGWGFRKGMLPGADGSTHRMAEFREWFVRAYSGAGSGA